MRHNTDTTQFSPCFVVFDIVYLNDQNMCHVPLSERIATLERVITPVPGYLVHAHRAVRDLVAQLLTRVQFGHTKEDFMKEANRAIDSREEGLIIKQPASHYKPGA